MRDIEEAKKAGGFDPRAFLWILESWFNLGKALRHPSYAFQSYPQFIHDAPPPRPDEEASAALYDKMNVCGCL